MIYPNPKLLAENICMLFTREEVMLSMFSVELLTVSVKTRFWPIAKVEIFWDTI